MTLTLTRRAAAIAAATAILFGSYLLGASRDHADAAVKGITGATTAPSGISVSGVGRATGTPDTLRVNLSLSVTGATVTDALATANAKTAAVQKSLRDSGVAAKDLQTTGLSVQPSYTSGKGGQPIVRGYQVQESMTAALRNLKTAGAAISAAAKAGGQATRIDGISLDLEDTGLITNARANAFAEARAKAEQYARAAGVSLGRVVSIQETVQTSVPQPYAYAAAAAPARDLQAVPVQAGSQELSVTVTVSFAIG